MNWKGIIIKVLPKDVLSNIAAVGQPPIILVLRSPSRAIVSVVKAYPLAISLNFWVGQKKSPTNIRQNFAKIIYQNVKWMILWFLNAERIGEHSRVFFKSKFTVLLVVSKFRRQI